MVDPTPPLSGPAAAPPGVERRKHVRHPLSPVVCGHVKETAAGTLIPEEMPNISAGGIRLILDRPLDPNAVAVLDLYNVPRNYPCRESFRVVYQDRRPDGRFAVGGAFTRRLGSIEIQELV